MSHSCDNEHRPRLSHSTLSTPQAVVSSTRLALWRRGVAVGVPLDFIFGRDGTVIATVMLP